MRKNDLKKEKDFDCIKMKTEIQTKLYEEIKNLTFKEQREYISKMLNRQFPEVSY